MCTSIRFAFLCWIAVALFSRVLVSPVLADAEQAETSLEALDLQKLSSQVLLKDEKTINDQFREIRRLKRAVVTAEKDLVKAVKRAEAHKHEIIQYIQKRRGVRKEMDRAEDNVKKYNQLVRINNEITDRISLLEEDTRALDAAKEARAEYNQSREAYIELVLELRKLYDATQEKYEALSVNKDVKLAIEEINKGSERTYTLGPSATFKSHGLSLKKVEDTVLSETIEMQKAGNIYYLSAVFNGKHTIEMSVDTGSSLCMLPAEAADEAGLSPSGNDPVIAYEMPDGRIFEARKVVAPRLRIGKFEVKKVECAVMDPKYSNINPIIGQSFLQHFSYKIDSAAGTITMTKIDK